VLVALVELVWLLVRLQLLMQSGVTEEPLPLEQSPWLMVGLEAVRPLGEEERSARLNMEDFLFRSVVPLVEPLMSQMLFSAPIALSFTLRSAQAQEQTITATLLAH
jgi:hypothetical protein